MLYTKEDMEEGAKILQEFFAAFGASSSTPEDAMEVDGEDSVEEQLKHLKTSYEAFRPRIEANPWCQTILNEL